MTVLKSIWQCMAVAVAVGALLASIPSSSAQPLPPQTNIVVLVVRGAVEISPRGSDRWLKLQPGETLSPGDRVRVGPRSQLGVRLADQSLARFDEQTIFEVQPPRSESGTGFRARVVAGLLYFFHRDKPSQLEVETRLASAAVRGTEFALRVENDVTILTVIDGEVEMSNPLGAVTLIDGTEGVAREGEAPVRRPALDIPGTIQWTLYYPGVLDTSELDQNGAVTGALQAYNQGDLLEAAQSYPWDRAPASDAERVFRAALLLAAGQAAEAENEIAMLADKSDRNGRLAQALRIITEIVKRGRAEKSFEPESATEWLVESYRLQADRQLEPALAAARKSTELSPNFSFAWARVAELEFSFGRIERAAQAVQLALKLGPKNAQALALEGFLFAARNRTSQALERFDQAIAVDPALANAWLGRGLTRIRTGQLAAGKADLLAAAALEPRRAVLRSYLGKAWVENRQTKLAEHELELAKQLDPLDPTAWLYSALLKEQQNRINEAVRDLEHAQNLNTNRAVYRSGFLLDQDRAVRSANLARIYRDAGMSDWSVREASRAVSADYGNYSAHLFLAESYSLAIDALNRRWETSAESEFLTANLLAPIEAGVFSPAISQHEYAALFERDRTRVVSTTEYLSRGSWTESASIFGTSKSLAYNLDVFYRDDPGQRQNDDLNQRQWSLQLKPRISNQDTIFLRADFGRLEGGDLAQRYNHSAYNPSYRFKEEQDPALLIGYHREWTPESHTLLLAGLVNQHVNYEDDFRPGFMVSRLPGRLDSVSRFQVEEIGRHDIDLYTLEPQQIWRTDSQSTVVGLRGQIGSIETEFTQTNPSFPVQFLFPLAPKPSAEGKGKNDFERLSAYVYHRHKILESLWIEGGIGLDYLRFPANWRYPPTSDETESESQISPKAGFLWTPQVNTAMRAAYSRSLGGTSLDQSYRIEPSQVAGFNQAFRSVIPESIAGGNAGAEFDSFSLSFERKFSHDTFIVLGAELLKSDVARSLGAFDRIDLSWFSLEQELNYEERSALIAANQLIGRSFSVAAQYRVSQAELDSFFPQVGPATRVRDMRLASTTIGESLRSVLHELRLAGLCNHHSGFFAEASATWRTQSNFGYEPNQPGDSFWQFHLLAGWRSAGRRVEIAVGLLNATDQDFQLTPLNIVSNLPRERTVQARARLNF